MSLFLRFLLELLRLLGAGDWLESTENVTRLQQDRDEPD